MTNYDVKGMSCAACQARVEKAVNGVDGVTSCAVSLLTNSMSVEGDVSPDVIINAVKAAGYKAKVSSGKISFDDDTSRIRNRLIISAAVLLVLMYFSMGVMMFGWPMPPFIPDSHIAVGIIEMILSGAIIFINRIFFIRGFGGLIHKSPNMDTLVSLGSGVSYVWSLYVLISMIIAHNAGDMDKVVRLGMNLYFESAAMILVLITIGKLLEAVSKGRTTDALKSLMALAPKTANVIRDGAEVTVPVEEVKVGDEYVVRAGDAIPVDGVIVEGNCAVDESALTGESIPVDKTSGDTISAATISKSGYVRCRAEKVGQDTTLSQIIKLVSDAATTKAPIARVADKVSGIFVPTVIGIAIVTFIVWMLIGREFAFSLERAISVLVISCPCALGLATPVAIMVANGRGARCGILFKTSEALEVTGRTKTVVLDKTGTITRGEPAVTDTVPAGMHSKEDLMRLAYVLESHSEHPLSRAITEAYDSDKIPDIDDFEVLSGSGLRGVYEGRTLTGGSLKYISQEVNVPEDIKGRADELSAQGKTPLLFAYDNELLGMIAVADIVKEDSAQAIAALNDMGIRTVMLTGDNERTARAIGESVGIKEVVAGVMPSDKADMVKRFKSSGHTVMIGDGINDAPALTVADVGIAIGAGTDVAIDAADVVLVKNSLMDAVTAIRLSRKTLTNIHENLFWAFIYNCIGIPLAAGCFIHLFGWELTPMFGAAAMSMSSFCVVMNALRLNWVRL
ncbi:MAG: heavy metal translocating P-type ATPase [Lachnospiraceae bacterium]|nr:heavy metal translocating P-type ATPase [Lachnospiraceae bacterium]